MKSVQRAYEKGLQLVYENRFDRAKRMFEKIQKENVFASFYIGRCMMNDNILPNMKEYETCKKAAVRIFKRNMEKYENAYQTDSTPEKKYILGYLYTRKFMGKYYDFDKGFQLVKRAAKDGYAPAQDEYARIIQFEFVEFGKFSESEKKVWKQTAFLNYEKAASQDFGRAYYHLAECYSYGHLDTKINPMLAMKYYKEGAKHNFLVCHTDIASRILRDTKQKDKSEAVKYLTEASKQRYARADRFLAICYHNGYGCQQNINEAIKVAKRSAKAGHVQTNLVLYNIYKDIGNERLAAKYGRAYFVDLKYISKNSHMRRFYLDHMGDCYFEGIGTRKNRTKAIEYYKKAASAPYNYTLCMNKLASIFLDKDSKYYDFVIGSSYLERALEKNDVTAAHRLGQVWEDRRDIQKAKHYYKIGVENGHPESFYSLGIIYANEGNHDRNAIDLLQNAYNKGVEEAFLPLDALNSKYLDSENTSHSVKIEELAQVVDKSRDEMVNSRALESINTAIFIYKQLKIYSQENNIRADFSPVITLLSKAVEIEFKRYFKSGYIKYLIEKGVKPSELSNLKGVVIENASFVQYDVDDYFPFTMGNIIHVLNINPNPERVSIERIDKKYSIPYKGDETCRIFFKTKHIVDYFDKIFKRDSFSTENRYQEIMQYLYALYKDLKFLKDYLRNSAVHSSVMNIYDANIAIDLIILSKRMIFSLKEKLKEVEK